MSYKGPSPPSLELIMFNAGTFELGWHSQYSCTGGCDPGESNIFISQESQAFVVAMYHNNFIRIFEISLTEGSTRSTGVQSATAYSGASKPIMVQFGPSDTQVIISYPYNGGSNMIIWSTSNSSVVFSYNTIAGSTKINSIVGSQSNGMLYFTSIGANTLNILKFYYYDPSITSSQFSGTISLGLQTSASLSSSSVSLGSGSSPTLSNRTTNIGDVSATQLTNNTYDIVYVNGRDQFHSVISGYSGNISFDYFCTKITSRTLTARLYEINSANPVSSWLSIDSSYTHLSISTAPTVTTDTNYTYGISYFDGNNDMTSENIIGVYLCSVSNCANCEYSTRSTTCTTCDTGYTLSSGGTNCEKDLVEDEEAKAVATTVKVIAGASIAVSVASALSGVSTATSVSSGSSSGSGQSIWALINQYQLIILLPMLGTHLENDFEFYITEFELVSFDFDFMDFITFPFIDSQIDGIDYKQPEKLFRNNGVESGSFFFNHYRFVKVMLIFLILNLIFVLTQLIITKVCKPKHQCWKKLFSKGSGFFHFGVYVRSMIEASLFICISSILEFSQFDYASDHKLSYSLACIAIVGILVLTFLIPVHYFKYRDGATIKSKYLSQLYDGTKDTTV